MSDLRLSTATEKLLTAAKADMPSATARMKVWQGVSNAVGGAAAASGATASVAMTGGASATKVLAIAGLFGATLAVGLAAVLLRVGPFTAPPSRPPMVVAAPAHAAVTTSALDAVPSSTGGEPPNTSDPLTRGTDPPGNRMRIPSRSAKPVPHEGSLAREALLVVEARGALERGEPRSALRAIREARALPFHQLVPEELAVEEQALRAVGQSDEANGIDVQLRLQYPESALAR